MTDLSQSQAWVEHFEALQEFSVRYGVADPGPAYVGPDGRRLGVWAATQRQRFSDGELLKWQVELLEPLPGWDWSRSRSSRQLPWDEALQKLQQFRQESPASDPPSSYFTDDNFPLGSWLTRQRELARAGRLTADQLRRLDAVGFTMKNRNEQKRERLFAALEAFAGSQWSLAHARCMSGRWLEPRHLGDAPAPAVRKRSTQPRRCPPRRAPAGLEMTSGRTARSPGSCRAPHAPGTRGDTR